MIFDVQADFGEIDLGFCHGQSLGKSAWPYKGKTQPNWPQWPICGSNVHPSCLLSRFSLPTFRHMKPDVRQRFFELRYDGERKISGTALVYGDRASMPWGDEERFEPGAFGDLGVLDVILNVQHERGLPLARTQGGGLQLEDSKIRLDVSADIPETTAGNDALQNIKARILRGLSIEFIPREYTIEKEEGEPWCEVIQQAELVGVAVVDRPAYSQSVIDQRRKQRSNRNMDEDKIRQIAQELLEKALKERSDGDIDTSNLAENLVGALTPAMREGVAEEVKAQVDAALKERDEAREATEKAEKDRKDAEDRAKEERGTIVADAEKRAKLIVQVADLLPKEFDTEGKTRHEILIAAVGDEVENAEDRSEDYLEAKVEGILERREKAATPPAGDEHAQDGSAYAGGTVNILKWPGRPTPGTVRGTAPVNE